MSAAKDIEHRLADLLEDKMGGIDPELVKAYALLRLANVLQEIGVYAFGTDAARAGSDQRSVFERLAADLPPAIESVAEAIRGEE